jgi:hypothetical protein
VLFTRDFMACQGRLPSLSLPRLLVDLHGSTGRRSLRALPALLRRRDLRSDGNQAALALGAAMAASRPRRAAKAAINRVLSLLGLGDTLKLTAVRTAPNAPR